MLRRRELRGLLLEVGGAADNRGEEALQLRKARGAGVLRVDEGVVRVGERGEEAVEGGGRRRVSDVVLRRGGRGLLGGRRSGLRLRLGLSLWLRLGLSLRLWLGLSLWL